MGQGTDGGNAAPIDANHCKTQQKKKKKMGQG